MNSTTLFSQIRTLLNRLADDISQANTLHLHNDAIHAENFFCELLNLIFGWQLENGNSIKSNQETFDLSDKEQKIFVQVTSTKSHQNKYKKVMGDLKRANGKYAEFHLVFISKSVDKSLLKPTKEGNTKYEGWDISKLADAILYKKTTSAKLLPLYNMLAFEINPLPLSLPAKVKPITLPKQIPFPIRKGTLHIERKSLIDQLYKFMQDGNGLITGGPGYGKSFVITELQRHCQQRKVPCFVIKINELLTGDADELGRELGTNSNWLEALQHVPLGQEHPLLVFDAFDTAKEEVFKTKVLKHVRSAIDTLDAHWRVAVSTRSYDAKKSLKLAQLFPKAKGGEDIGCRYAEIPMLSDHEVTTAIALHKVLKRAYGKANKALKELLRIPYFLDLFKQVASENEVVNVQTEEQLLTLYWKTRIATDANKDLFLRKLTGELSSREALSCKKSSLVTHDNIAIFEALLSDGIIVETSYTNENLAFAHNILLEYAIFKYEIPQDNNEFIRYLSEHERQPFLFRSSFIYFYATLWTYDRVLFWEHYFAIKKISEPLFRLVHQTILNYVLAYYFEKTSDLDLILHIVDEDDRSATTRKMLEAIRYVRLADLKIKDLHFFLSISKEITPAVVWDLGFLISRAIKQYSAEDAQHKILGQLSKNYLTYYLSVLGNPVLKGRVEGNAIQWAIPNYLQSYAFVNTPQKLIHQLLQFLAVPDFNIGTFHFLAENILSIAKSDIPFALEIYKTLYNHSEKSDTETFYNNSVVVSFRSNRRQDYGMVCHRLEERFEPLLQLNTVDSGLMAISIIDERLLTENSYRRNFAKEVLFVNRQPVTLFEDWSTYDHDTDGKYGLLSHAHRIEQALDELCDKGESVKVNEALICFLQHAKSSTLWLSLMGVMIKYPAINPEIISSILSQVSIYKFEKIRAQAANLICVAWPHLNNTQKEQIEKAIFSIPMLAYYDETRMETLKARLYSHVPVGELTLPSSIKLLNAYISEGTHEDEDYPVNFHHYFSADREKEWLEIRADEEAQQEAFRLLKHIDEFIDSHAEIQNKPLPSGKKYQSYLPSAKKLFNLRSSSFPVKLLRQCDIRLCEFAEKVLDKFTVPINVKEWITDLAFFYIDCDIYLGPFERGTFTKHHDAMSRTPRSEATSILSKLRIKYNDIRVREKLLILMRDNTQYVRLKAIRTLRFYYTNSADTYWSQLHEIFTHEHDGLCLTEALAAMHYKDVREKDWERIITMLWLINDRIHTEKAPEDLERKFATLLIFVLLNHVSRPAVDLLNHNAKNKEFCQAVILCVFSILDYSNKGKQAGLTAINRTALYSYLEVILTKQFELIEPLKLDDPIVSNALYIVDFCVQRLYFKADRNPATKSRSFVLKSQKDYLQHIRRLLDIIVNGSKNVDNGYMVAHSGYYLMQLLNFLLPADPQYILALAAETVTYAAKNNFTYDHTTMTETVKFAERILVDYKYFLKDKKNFNLLISILDHFAYTGWTEAVELIWRLKEIF